MARRVLKLGVDSRLARMSRRLDAWSPRAIVALGTVLVVLLMVVDYATGTEISVSIFYLIPVGLVSWFGGRRAGFLVCVMSGLAWLIVDLALATYSHAAIHYWNSLVRFGFFFSVSSLSAEVRRSRRQQEELVRSMVEDLRAPLRNAMLGLDILEHEAGPAMSATARQVVSLTRSAGFRMWPLIHSLAEMSRFESSELPVEPCDVSVERLIRSAFDHVGLWAWNRGVRLEMDAACETASVHADVDVTVRVLVNLLTRLIDAAPSGATIRMSVHAEGPRTTEIQGTRSAIDTPAALALGGATSGAPSTSDPDPSLRFCEQAMAAQHGRLWLAVDRDRAGLVVPEARTSAPPVEPATLASASPPRRHERGLH